MNHQDIEYIFLMLESRELWSRSMTTFHTPEPLEKKSGAGAAKKLAGGSSALREDKKRKEIVL